MWNSDGKPEHAVRFARCPESGTISPVGSPDLVLGAKLASTNIVLVPRGDPLQLVFDDDAVLTARIQAQQEAAAAAIKQLEAEAEALVDPKMLRQLREVRESREPHVIDRIDFWPGAILRPDSVFFRGAD